MRNKKDENEENTTVRMLERPRRSDEGQLGQSIPQRATVGRGRMGERAAATVAAVVGW